MGFMKHFRSRSRLRSKESNGNVQYHAPVYGADFTARLPPNVLQNIFSFVCPHVLDESYDVSENSPLGDGCMLCDLRDLSRCALVRKSWYGVAQGMLYKSIRIDAVHYCEREEFLADQRRRKSRHGDPPDVPAIRLQLLSRTVRERQRIAEAVQILKLPYMTRETCKADLARTVSVLPNLQYVDLPDGFFTGDPTCHTLRQELQARCPDIRRMKYDSGSETSFEILQQYHWQMLEVLELSRLRVEPILFRRVLACLPTLHELILTDIPWLSDT
ncbi:hypothetical protein M501DRAFT_1014014, partial [Patellaria atrata CBS 101060]